MSVGRAALSCLNGKGLDVAQKQVPQARASVARFYEMSCANAQGGNVVAKLDEGAVRRAVCAEHQGSARETLTAVKADLDFVAVGLGGGDGADSIFKEVSIINRRVGLVERLTMAKADTLQVRPEQGKVIRIE
jgi:hypothetical protein